jgi:hypothetical protein
LPLQLVRVTAKPLPHCQKREEQTVGATKIMVIRHAEKPGCYDGRAYGGINATGAADPKSLVTIGWERAGALVTLFAPPWGPNRSLAQPQHIYAADHDPTDREPSQRPYETVTALAAKLGLKISAKHKRNHYSEMVSEAVAKGGVVLISWQHEDLPLQNADGQPGISQCILTATGTSGTLGVPTSWPKGSKGGARYDLVWVFDRPSGNGPIQKFTQFAQMLLPGDETAPA